MALVKHCSCLRFFLLPVSPPKSRSSQRSAIIYLCVPHWELLGGGQGFAWVFSVAQRSNSKGGHRGGAQQGLPTTCLVGRDLQGQSARPQPQPAFLPGSALSALEWIPGSCPPPPIAPGSHLTSQQCFLLLAMPFFSKHPFLWTLELPPISLAISS